MTAGSDDDVRTPDDEPTAIDAAWDALLEETGKDGEESSRDGVPVAAAGAPAASGLHRRDRADDEMARLMAGEAPKLPVVEPEPPIATPEAPIASSESPIASSESPIARVESPIASSESPIARVEPPIASSEPPIARVEPPIASSEPPIARTPIAAVVPLVPRHQRETEDDRPTRIARETEEDRPARASRPAELDPSPSASGGAVARGVPWAWIGAGMLALSAAAYLGLRGGSSDEDDGAGARRTTASSSAPAEVIEPEPSPAAKPPPDAGSQPDDEPEGDDPTPAPDAGVDDEPSPPRTARTGDPREPPPGTPPEVAAAVRRLPVSVSDRPPVGGIGASGIHIDQIAMGSKTDGATCSGHNDAFSVGRREHASVCVRVVHAREKEELQVLWQRHGGSARRSKMVVLPMHAYRTRAHLVLRSEYIGDWTVRILSSDGVELARHDFTVVP